ncbi:hypothetical protein SK128_007289, partial [Halocaridina rubra]
MFGFHGGNDGGGGGGAGPFPSKMNIDRDSRQSPSVQPGPSNPISLFVDVVVQHVFEEDLQQMVKLKFPNSLDLYDEPVYRDLRRFTRLCLHKVARPCEIYTKWSPKGRLPEGSTKVQFDVKKCVGNFSFSNDRLGLNSQDNFSTIRANTCVYE